MVSVTTCILTVLIGFGSFVRSYYTEEYRPQFHFTPEQNWMNDPNGLVYHNGQYHLFYQYNPNGTTWGFMSWGHAVSTDLVHWKHLPIALECESDSNGNVLEMFFSGSAVVDVNNTTGFAIPVGKDRRGHVINSTPMVAIYTSYYPTAHTQSNGVVIRAGQQSQSIAFSNDNGLTWTQYEGNPVIESPPAGYVDQYQNFRDPFVFWYSPSSKWIMVASLANEHILLIYSSDNLKTWKLESQFGPENAKFGQWECPSLFPLYVDGNNRAEKWVILMGVNPGGVITGSGTQYIIGSFNGTTFVADPSDTYDPTQIPAGSIVFQNFESTSSTFKELGWKATGDFALFGPQVASSVTTQTINGNLGSGLLTTWIVDDSATGTIISPKFIITKNYISFLIAGGYYPYNPSTAGTANDNQVSFSLIVGGQVVHSQTGADAENLVWRSWNVAGWFGEEAYFIVTDLNTNSWGHLHVDEIIFSDTPKVEANWNDFGPDYYAAATYNGLPTADRIAIGWMNNWAYGGNIPTSPWRSAMSVPRKLALKTINNNVLLVQQPVSSLSSLYTPSLYSRKFSSLKSGETEIPVPAPYNARMKLTVSFKRGTGSKFGVILRSNATNTQETIIGYDFLGQNVFVDRFKSGDNAFVGSEPNQFPGHFIATLPSTLTDSITLNILLDWSSVEVFDGNGQVAFTSQIFPLDDSAQVKLFSVGGTTRTVTVAINGMKSSW
ncbi:glycosyl hydrolase [Lipomyces tetrasporus]|uniref:Glycosyl hydrolase n=1 Tax=Lipomyces tetrasporus TaxID=54092 RepID=A0AAD7QUX3_9ASCO|nr:glycosyl hydrolase [Lipomyces tetrasporus]KAJ8100187.1 glycosyl hydrolase [Lipomyces tetrasporus]